MKKRILGVLIATTGMMMAESELMMVTKHKNYFADDGYIVIEAKEKFLLDHKKVKVDKFCSTYDDVKTRKKYEKEKAEYRFGNLDADVVYANQRWTMLSSLTPDIRKTPMKKGQKMMIRLVYHCGIENVNIEAKGKVHRFVFPGEEEAKKKYTGKRNEYVKFDERGEI